ncbi:Vegetative incompatibility protein HET-E-1 [Cyphellophora attinorum]|uniref:Vegetative incompatibility protein HET-E-1 n=1 Tax=Cyphellophora attinorum TaxID=1664694 RepID=A0A0N0NMZ7_9EURO|nr:Vegetative incompatibility protein HET-E-1 [Phialophora attinorum]KPI40928.1 Vegetative incompatibility protein HET-E-1 [Phialophora attinorum]
MRLLKQSADGSFHLTSFDSNACPPYAILSHTWGKDDSEVTFEDIEDGAGREKAGYEKLRFCAEQARKDGLDHFWVDTCCIKKSDLAELSEAITSMFRWYRRSANCYVLLTDVTHDTTLSPGDGTPVWREQFHSSAHHTRGWTLQEILAPHTVHFFSKEGKVLGERRDLAGAIEEATTIPVRALTGEPLTKFSVAERMRWSEGRNTTKAEDRAYCLLGLFGISLVPNYGEGIRSALRRLSSELDQKFREEVRDAGKTLIQVVQKDPRDRSHALSVEERNAQWEKNRRRRGLLDLLRPENLNARQQNVRDAQHDTCKWFLEHPAVVKWNQQEEVGDHRGFLWLRGNPGTGKSTIMKFAHQHYLGARPNGEVVISFFFNARGAMNEKTTHGMWMSLLYQLLEAAPDQRDLVFELSDTDDFKEASDSGRVGLTIPKLLKVFRQSVLSLGQRPLRCFIDALDECDAIQVQEMLEEMKSLSQIAIDADVDVRICFASRHYPNVIFEYGQRLILEREPGHREDLDSYVESHLRRFNSVSAKVVQRISTQILDKANGSFLWTVLVVATLQKELSAGNIRTVEKKLAEIPLELSELFRRILLRDIQNLEDTCFAFQCVQYARRPLHLVEYYYAVSTGSGPPDELDEAIVHDPDEATQHAMELYVTHTSRGLLEVTSTILSVVQFIHETIRHWFQGGALCDFFPELGSDLAAYSHDRIARCCSSYMHHARKYHRTISVPDLLQMFPFLTYATAYSLQHAEKASQCLPQAEFLEHFDVEFWVLSWRLKDHSASADYYSRKADLLYVLASENCPNLIRTLCSEGVRIGVEGELYRFPLFAAIVRSNDEAVNALLQFETGANLPLTAQERQALDQNGADRHYPTPLLWAVKQNHEKAALAMLKAVDIDRILTTCDGDGLNALDHAVAGGLAEATKELLALGLTPGTAAPVTNDSPWSYASESSHNSSTSDVVSDAIDAISQEGSQTSEELTFYTPPVSPLQDNEPRPDEDPEFNDPFGSEPLFHRTGKPMDSQGPLEFSNAGLPEEIPPDRPIGAGPRDKVRKNDRQKKRWGKSGSRTSTSDGIVEVGDVGDSIPEIVLDDLLASHPLDIDSESMPVSEPER